MNSNQKPTSGVKRLEPIRSSASKTKKSKKPRALPILLAVKPLNMEAEKKKFFEAGGRYDPQFVYPSDVTSKSMTQHGQASSNLLTQALKIIQSALEKFRSYSNWEQQSGGAIMSKQDVMKHVTEYLQTQGMASEVQVNITPSILSHASMSRVKGKPTINIREGTTHQNWIDGMLNHELGTHYLRAYNNSKQPWKSKKRRKKLGLLPANPTEEGLASINTHINRPQPVLLRSAILYVTIFMASKMSFSQVYEYLKKYIDCPEARWKYLMRAKRGQTDTSLPGCFTKDQIYLTGCLQILSRRSQIDFELLYRYGKVSYRDIDKLRDTAVRQGTRIPQFIADRDWYINRLEFIMAYNDLTDEDFKGVDC